LFSKGRLDLFADSLMLKALQCGCLLVWLSFICLLKGIVSPPVLYFNSFWQEILAVCAFIDEVGLFWQITSFGIINQFELRGGWLGWQLFSVTTKL
jgi:hypothetical protein